MQALVIDDSRTMRMILTKILKQIGISVIEASDGADALDKLAKTGPVDLALVDWNMPNVNGFEFVVAVRANPAWSSMQLVMCTTESDIANVQRALDAGASEYVMKPFTAEMIAEKLSMLGLSP